LIPKREGEKDNEFRQRFSTIAISDKINKDSNQPLNQGRFHHGTTGKLSMGKLVRGNS